MIKRERAGNWPRPSVPPVMLETRWKPKSIAAPSLRQGHVISALNASEKRMSESSCDAITTGSGKQVHRFSMRIELMAWFGNFFLIAGQFKLGRKHWCAPWICNVGNALYLVYSAEKHAWALFAMTAVAFVIMVRCAILWRPRGRTLTLRTSCEFPGHSKGTRGFAVGICGRPQGRVSILLGKRQAAITTQSPSRQLASCASQTQATKSRFSLL